MKVLDVAMTVILASLLIYAVLHVVTHEPVSPWIYLTTSATALMAWVGWLRAERRGCGREHI